MGIWTISEIEANIAILKEAYTKALGQAERERYQEGTTQYETTNAVKQIRKDLEQAQKDLEKAKMDAGLITRDGFDLSDLNPKELNYFKMMYAQSGVLFLTSAPGIAKSAMQRSLSQKMKKVEIIFKPNTEEVDCEKSGKLLNLSEIFNNTFFNPTN